MGEVEELPATISQCGEAPVAFADGLPVLVFPVHGALVVPALLLLKQGDEAACLFAERLDAVACIEGRIVCTGELQAGGHHVEEAAWLRHDGSLLILSHTCRPMDDGRRCRAAMELSCLPVAVRRVDGSCPTRVQVVVGELTAGRR